MATLYISEYSAPLAPYGTNTSVVQVVDESTLLAEQTVTVSTEQDSATLQSGTRLVRISTDTACHIKFAASPTATTSMKFIPANHVEYFGIPGTSGYKVSVIAHS